MSQLSKFGVRWIMQDAGPDILMSSTHDAPQGSALDNAAEGNSQHTQPDAPTTQVVASSSTRDVVAPKSGTHASARRGENVDARTRLLQTQCLKLSLSILSRPDHPARSLGFTSAIPGEGKSSLAILTATALADRGRRPVTLVDCNWDAPALHSRFGVAETPGLAEWLRHECTLEQIRCPISQFLTVIPAGNGIQDAVALTEALKGAGTHSLLTDPAESLIVDMATVLTSSYGALLAQRMDAVLLVVRAGGTWDSYIQNACQELAAAALEGVVLNATRSRIPRWLQRIL